MFLIGRLLLVRQTKTFIHGVRLREVDQRRNWDIGAPPEIVDRLDRGNLLSFLADYKAPPLTLYAIYPPTRHLAVKVRLFIDFLVARFSASAAKPSNQHLAARNSDFP